MHARIGRAIGEGLVVIEGSSQVPSVRAVAHFRALHGGTVSPGGSCHPLRPTQPTSQHATNALLCLLHPSIHPHRNPLGACDRAGSPGQRHGTARPGHQARPAAAARGQADDGPQLAIRPAAAVSAVAAAAAAAGLHGVSGPAGTEVAAGLAARQVAEAGTEGAVRAAVARRPGRDRRVSYMATPAVRRQQDSFERHNRSTEAFNGGGWSLLLVGLLGGCAGLQVGAREPHGDGSVARHATVEHGCPSNMWGRSRDRSTLLAYQQLFARACPHPKLVALGRTSAHAMWFASSKVAMEQRCRPKLVGRM